MCLFDASSDSDIPKNVPFTFVINTLIPLSCVPKTRELTSFRLPTAHSVLEQLDIRRGCTQSCWGWAWCGEVGVSVAHVVKLEPHSSTTRSASCLSCEPLILYKTGDFMVLAKGKFRRLWLYSCLLYFPFYSMLYYR